MTESQMATPPHTHDKSATDDTAICPACDGSGFGVADTYCGFCGGCGGLPIAVAEDFYNSRAAIAKAIQP